MYAGATFSGILVFSENKLLFETYALGVKQPCNVENDQTSTF